MSQQTRDVVYNDGVIYLKPDGTSAGDITLGYDPALYFRIKRVCDGAELGLCDLRLGHNRYTEISGNLGYRIFDAHRGHGYACRACLLMAAAARDRGLGYIVISCEPSNTASKRTCEKTGAHLLGLFDIPVWHRLYSDTRRVLLRYRIDLGDYNDRQA